MARSKGPALVFSDREGTVYDYPGMRPMFRTGTRFVPARLEECIGLPYGSLLFSLPDRYPVSYNGKKEALPVRESPGGNEVWAVSAFLPSSYLRTYLPAFVKKENARALTLWAYAGVAFREDGFIVPALRIDDDPRSDPAIHENEDELNLAIAESNDLFPENRLVEQLAHCAVEYRCLCARNFFLGRYEAPVPTTPGCNAGCAGCLSAQDGASGFMPSQERISFSPTPGEIAEVMLRHIGRVERGVASFGQGCEGEPLLRGRDLADAVAKVRTRTGKGTIHLNTNGSLPDMAKLLIGAGLDSIRVSLNSPTEEYYDRYYRPRNYGYRDVLKTIELSLEAGIFVSINLLVMPGFTDMETEADSLFRLLDEYPVNMVQTRNLNIDPDYYFESIGFRESEPIGIVTLLAELRSRYPKLRIGYYNPPKETF